MNISHKRHEELNIPGTINLVASILITAIEKLLSEKTLNYLESPPTKKNTINS